MRRHYDITPAAPVRARPPAGGGLYLITAEPTGRVLYIGRTWSFRSRRYRRHHRRYDWVAACAGDERALIRFAILCPSLSPTQLRDIEARLIGAASPPCNVQHVSN